MLDDLIIFQKTYDLILWIFPMINRFPKKQRFVLGQQIENELLGIIKDIILVNNERNKTEILKRISVRLDTLRILIRLAKDLKFLSIKQYENAAVKMNEIGKLLSGWMKKFAQ
ncbi:MAG TPA: diversity-generating retroelement protein Avd [Candidatus Paceibacterota bacterium]|mgnify:CR=1 FL=1|nr:diversity-generating retroelement protein Avd [Candidatus Paceibacterota bacterium]HOL53776.1 diversity-generating retroelement protein Avd [Candidatus Paceibacterota bacterium]HON21711.1 diversity-generating retroelement protein Avd [Candidatus Paceibacterota bacterium]HPP16824.1 diversity-generating retroelement protein Avd [Candidatus Paceibacterota bacterium]